MIHRRTSTTITQFSIFHSPWKTTGQALMKVTLMNNIRHLFCALFLFLGCNLDVSNEIVILLPGEVKGRPLVLAETSSDDVSINGDLVPSLIQKVWWNENLIVTENNPMKSRDLFQGDTFKIPDRFTTCWYVIHPQSDDVIFVSSHEKLHETVKHFGVEPTSVILLPLHKAQALREKQLGFRFTVPSVYSYLESQKKSNKPTVPQQ